MDGSGFGLGKRSQRYAMIVEDGTVTHLAVEAPGKLEVSAAEAILEGALIAALDIDERPCGVFVSVTLLLRAGLILKGLGDCCFRLVRFDGVSAFAYWSIKFLCRGGHHFSRAIKKCPRTKPRSATSVRDSLAKRSHSSAQKWSMKPNGMIQTGAPNGSLAFVVYSERPVRQHGC